VNSTVNKILSSGAAIGTFQPNRMDGGRRTPDGDPVRNYFPRIVFQSIFESAQRGRLDARRNPKMAGSRLVTAEDFHSFATVWREDLQSKLFSTGADDEPDLVDQEA
jgi:hypothetical protein